MVINTSDLGLAAYMKMQGCKLVTVNDREFVFESEVKNETEWKVEYLNSCCHFHDCELMTLRKLIAPNGKKRPRVSCL